MLIAITEHNSWENERWTYVLDLNKQDGQTINNLMIFVRLANEHYEIAKDDAPVPDRSSIFTRHTPTIFAASKYHVKFYDDIEQKDGRIRLINKKGMSMNLGSRGGYKSNHVVLDAIMSPKRMQSALISMRDKDKNILYKKFECLFLSKKSTRNATSKTEKVQ